MNDLSLDLLLPNELERRQIFYLLKRNSSLTAWKRRLGYYQKWADTAEKSVREAERLGLLCGTRHPPGYTTPYGVTEKMDDTSLDYSDYEGIKESLALFERGVERLSRGDKRVFAHDDQYGLFMLSFGQPSHYLQVPSKVAGGDTTWYESTPYSDEFFRTLDEFAETGIEAGRYIMQSRYERDLMYGAPFSYAAWEAVWLSRLAYPDPLPQVPEPANVFLATGDLVPYSGVWEPIGEGGRAIGTMNYLHGGSPAPLADQSYCDEDDEYGYDTHTIEVFWQLIWRDDRYEDGTIPDEETAYIFTRPLPLGAEDAYDCNIVEYMDKYGSPFLKGK